ncbi:hypothetical protein ACHAWU_006632 [Discostella pseudostelligera]|uniref:Uncharacterized protein n=1 Tax=Discostella pseudostelligera TaxID=259834 RepID=A0ABD3M7U7_9STRA
MARSSSSGNTALDDSRPLSPSLPDPPPPPNSPNPSIGSKCDGVQTTSCSFLHACPAGPTPATSQ